jgi:peptide methionine sulfoxide reductase MsrA
MKNNMKQSKQKKEKKEVKIEGFISVSELNHYIKTEEDYAHYYKPRKNGYDNGKFYTCHNKPCWRMKFLWKIQNIVLFKIINE